MRDRAGLVDLSAFAIFDVTGPGALGVLERLCVNRVDVVPGRTVYTPLLNAAGGILADLTIMRLAHDRFRVVTGGGMGMRDRKIFQDAMPDDGSAQLHDVTNAFTTFGLWGPRARDILGVAADGSADISHAGFPFLTSKTVDIDGVRTLASRISYVGELGWEIYVPIEQGLRVWDALWRAGQPHGLVPVGIGTYAVTARLEKGYRAHGAELELDFNLVEAGMARPSVKDGDFVGRAAYLRQRAEPPAAILCTLTVDDPTSKSGVKRYMLGREPILSADGRPLVDGKGRRSYVTSAGSGPSLGKHLLMAYLPPDAGGRGQPPARRVLRGALPGDRGRGREHPALRPDERPDPVLSGAMNVLVCVKRVPETGGRVTLTADEQAIDTRFLGFTVSPHEECAAEEAVRIVEAHGGSSTVLTLGPEAAADQLREAMAIGVERAILLETDGADWDPIATAGAIVDAIVTEREAGAPYDLLLFGNEAADSGDYQVGVRVAVALGLPFVGGVKSLEVRDGVAVCRREAAGGWEVFELPLPAVVAVREGINLPRYPSVPGRLRARKKEIVRMVPTARPGGPTKVRLRLPAEQERSVEILGDGPAAAPAVVELLVRMGFVGR